VVLEIRAIAPGGEAIEGLAAADFRVRLGGREARIESVDWLPEGGGSFQDLSWGEAAAGLAETGATVEAPEELTLVFIQADMEPSRVIGHLRMLQRTELLFGGLAPGDRMAVVSFDSRLRLRLDFTDDPAALARALEEGIGFGGQPPRIPPGPYPSLARHFDYQAAHDAANPERALEVAARALAPIPGRKSILFLGYGLGRLDARAGTVSMTADYRAAREVLTAARIPVFVLDVVDAAAHSLEVGLQQVAEDTGGRYERTAYFPSAAIKRIRRVMDGRYLLAFAVPAGLAPGEHKLRIDLPGTNGEVLAPPTLTIGDSSP
jgi:VWFA-related protein